MYMHTFVYIKTHMRFERAVLSEIEKVREMGYTKVPMEARDTLHHRKKTYRKRHPVLKRRVEELGVLCEADSALLMFSPSGHPSLLRGGTGDLAEILDKYSKVDPVERENRKNEVIAKLRKCYEKEGHEIDLKGLDSYVSEKKEEIKKYLQELEQQIYESKEKLRLWNNPEAIDDIVQITAMEQALQKSLERIQRQKVSIIELGEHSEVSSSVSSSIIIDSDLIDVSLYELFEYLIHVPISPMNELSEERIFGSSLHPDNAVTYNTIDEMRETWNSLGGPLLEDTWWDKVYNYDPSK